VSFINVVYDVKIHMLIRRGCLFCISKLTYRFPQGEKVQKPGLLRE